MRSRAGGMALDGNRGILDRLAKDDWSLSLLSVVVIGAVVVACQGWNSERWGGLAAGLTLVGASLLAGVLLGFLFGIPRSLQNQAGDHQPPSEDTNGKATGRRDSLVQYGANTNLEQISDWLTKILVGVGLSQLNNIPSFFGHAGAYFGDALGGGKIGTPLATTVIIYFSVAGFLAGYLWTRLFLGSQLVKADIAALNAALNQSVQEIKQAQEEQSQIDARALNLVNQYLQAADKPSIDLDELKNSVRKASAPVKVQIFYQARAARRDSRSQKVRLERTIPIFEALAAGDTAKIYHRNYGQLAFALIDKRQPDYVAAENALSIAIEIRGRAAENGYELYEFNRALCHIKEDPDYIQGKTSGAAARKVIRADLDIALKLDPELENPDVSKWQQLNP